MNICGHPLAIFGSGHSAVALLAIDAEAQAYKIQEAVYNVGLHVNLITLAHLSYFPSMCVQASYTPVYNQIFF